MPDVPGMNDEQLREWAESRVKAGAELLDRVRPGWADNIVLSNFYINLGCSCVVGQCTGNGHFEEGVRELLGRSDVYRDDAAALGLTLGVADTHRSGRHHEDLWEALQAAWETQIASRQKLIPDGITAL
jgi:hypothetical protein